jgi:hypothetical protein
MKNFQALFLLTALLFCTACSSQDKEMTDRQIPKKQATPTAEQKVSVANKTQTSLATNIGRRSAEEMVAAGFKRYGIEKGTLIFRMDGAVTGTENIYFDHWGWREGKYVQSQSDIGTFDQKKNTIQFLDGERRYEYNSATGEAYFFESRQVQKAADRYGTKDMTVVGDEMIKNMGGVVLAKVKIRGVECEVWDVDNYKTELSMWKGITMGERSHPENLPVARTCILLDTTSAIPLEKMMLPEGVKLIPAN